VPWALPVDPTARGIQMGNITELGNIVAGAFAHSDEAGNGEYLPLVGDFMSLSEIVDTLNRQGHKFSFKQLQKEVFGCYLIASNQLATTSAQIIANESRGAQVKAAVLAHYMQSQLVATNHRYT
jgi:hypothetical protein